MSGEMGVSWACASTTTPAPDIAWQVPFEPHSCVGGQPPQVPLHPSPPQVLPEQEGVQAAPPVPVAPPEAAAPAAPPVLPVVPPVPEVPPALVAPPEAVPPPALV